MFDHPSGDEQRVIAHVIEDFLKLRNPKHHVDEDPGRFLLMTIERLVVTATFLELPSQALRLAHIMEQGSASTGKPGRRPNFGRTSEEFFDNHHRVDPS